MQRVRQPADPTFTIGSPTLHRADGSSHAERRHGCSCQKGPFFPWITPTPSVRPNPPPTPPHLTRPPAGPPARRAPSAAAVHEAGNDVAAAAREACRALLVLRMTQAIRLRRSTTATTSSCRSRFARVAPPSKRPREPSCASRVSATPCRCPPRRLRGRQPRGPSPRATTGRVAPRSAGAGRDRRAARDASPRTPRAVAQKRVPTTARPGRRRAVGPADVAGVVPTAPNSTQRRSNSVVVVSATANRSGATSWRSRCDRG